MKATDIVKAIMGNKGINQQEITKMMGMKSQSAVSQALNRDMKISTLVRFLNTLDCHLVIRYGDTEYEVEE